MAVLSFEPLASLHDVEMLWLISLQGKTEVFSPLHDLKHLKSLRTTVRPDSAEFKALRSAVPSLQYFQPVG